jgi:hypothetical protein
MGEVRGFGGLRVVFRGIRYKVRFGRGGGNGRMEIK